MNKLPSETFRSVMKLLLPKFKRQKTPGLSAELSFSGNAVKNDI